MKNQVWCRMPIISVHGILRQEDHKFKANLIYTANPFLKKQTKKKMQTKK
jgi:hypothetical protein